VTERYFVSLKNQASASGTLELELATNQLPQLVQLSDWLPEYLMK
jgi:hypothetical protein